jgi:hypothetical protein
MEHLVGRRRNSWCLGTCQVTSVAFWDIGRERRNGRAGCVTWEAVVGHTFAVLIFLNVLRCDVFNRDLNTATVSRYFLLVYSRTKFSEVLA